MKKNFTAILVVLAMAQSATLIGQGCIAIRGNSVCGKSGGNLISLKKGDINTQLGIRYFKSFRHFRGDVEEKHRIEEGTQVINHSSFLDLSINYGLSDRFFINTLIPFVYHTRSSMYEHGGNPPRGLGERHETSASGLSDIRLGIGYWLFDPQKHDFNYSINVGVKLPTGQYDYKDQFHNQGIGKDEILNKVVDQSIQPGDGGTGLTLELQGIHPISHSFGVRTTIFYLFNFQETNGILTRNGSSEFSCADQYALSLGGYYSPISGLSIYLGGRIEGVPSKDLIGGSAGYRRPGYAISLEPGIGYSWNNYSINTSIPFALYRNRTRSHIDKERTAETGQYRHGDAAFADFLVNLSIGYTFNNNGH